MTLHNRPQKLLLALSISLVLSGCGGGGGGTATGNPGGGNFYGDTFNRQDAARLQTTKPVKGSVSQTTNFDAENNNITSDAIDLSISGPADNPRYTFSYKPDAAASTAYDLFTVNAKDGGDVLFIKDIQQSLGGISMNGLVVGNSYGWSVNRDGVAGNDGRMVAIIYSNYTGTTTDYLAGGLWAYVPDNLIDVNDIEVGAFIDGADGYEYEGVHDIPPRSAVYSGPAVGILLSRINTLGNTQYAVDDVSGIIELTADFDGANSSIEGEVRGMQLPSNLQIQSPISLAKADIGSDGFFRSTLNGALRRTGSNSVDVPIQINGHWGGQFYGIDAPDYVSGTLGGGGSGSYNSALGSSIDANFMMVYAAEPGVRLLGRAALPR